MGKPKVMPPQKAGGGHKQGGVHVGLASQMQVTKSFYQHMVDGKEYESIVGWMLEPGLNLVEQVKLGIREIEAVRKRPCIAYLGNVVKGSPDSAIVDSDDLPFAELVNSVPNESRSVDVLLATNGGLGHQVPRFVSCLRNRFDEVDFLIPSKCMSAGTLFALSGDRIWMNPLASLGPIDPQVSTAEGRMVPAQSLVLLVRQLQEQGEKSMKEGKPPPWTAVRIVDTIDKRELGHAITATQYSTTMATQFLMDYKLRNWAVRETSKEPVTDEYREARAKEVGEALASHDRWKSHGHSISRDVLWNEIRLKIDHPDEALERAIRRAWAVCYWIFDKMPIHKMLLADNFGYIRHTPIPQGPAK